MECGDYYLETKDLKLHRRKQHGSTMLLKCTKCPKKYAWKRDMERHQTHHHGQNTSQIIQQKPQPFQHDSAQTIQFQQVQQLQFVGVSSSPVIEDKDSIDTGNGGGSGVIDGVHVEADRKKTVSGVSLH